QVIQIPKELQLEDTELVINKISESLIITPRNALKDMFFSGIDMLSDDFMKDEGPELPPV
ncbi:MAG: AbrB/MazE/SpoVT family DNA-binding domain-containing protein, partial [Lachnospiraceae bacterium]|nr:AbrB/MazE/SpoVT family DNA-binding domain-containing protein [Lachnospiraceae bacterium]